ncbi:MAG TPA: hypothetical protein VKB43_03400 [Gaiellaceae bacterium]|nr:hypothetical protein [Gaiellaceae bacterium]
MQSSSETVADPSICGTAANPESDPEALGVINAPAAFASGITGAGVSTAYLAGPIDPTINDFQRVELVLAQERSDVARGPACTTGWSANSRASESRATGAFMTR